LAKPFKGRKPIDVYYATVRTDHIRLTSENEDASYLALNISTQTKYRKSDEKGE
jgi:hypothetical protein